MAKKITREEFIHQATEKHGGKYDYSKVQFLKGQRKVCIICPIHGEFYQSKTDHINGHGCKFCRFDNLKIKRGRKFIGINDVYGSYKDPMKSAWKNMIKRCMDSDYQKIRKPSYIGCTVCDDWKFYSKFKEWVLSSESGYVDGYHLDKDLLLHGNRLYSPSTCCFLPPEINTLLITHKSRRGNLPIGVSLINRGGYIAYTAQLSTFRGHRYLGVFSSIEAAFETYKQAKEEHIKNLAIEYYSKGEITKRVYDALISYEVYITD